MHTEGKNANSIDTRNDTQSILVSVDPRLKQSQSNSVRTDELELGDFPRTSSRHAREYHSNGGA